jgi:uncharacterized protein YqhQ
MTPFEFILSVIVIGITMFLVIPVFLSTIVRTITRAYYETLYKIMKEEIHGRKTKG